MKLHASGLHSDEVKEGIGKVLDLATDGWQSPGETGACVTS
jgi:hypothetical protein